MFKADEIGDPGDLPSVYVAAARVTGAALDVNSAHCTGFDEASEHGVRVCDRRVAMRIWLTR